MKKHPIPFAITILVLILGATSAYGIVRPLSSSKADFEFTWNPNEESPNGWFLYDNNPGELMYGNLQNERDKRHQKLIYMIARFDFVANLPTIGADILIPDGQGTIINGGPGKENLDVSFSTNSTYIVVEQSWLLSECPESEILDLSSLNLSFREANGGVLDANNHVQGGTQPALLSLIVRTRCQVPDSGATGALLFLSFATLVWLRRKRFA